MGLAPKISVLMPTLNGAPFLREALESILNQDMRDFELIVIDDGSTDETIPIVKSYSDRRIRLIQSESRQGISRSLNQGIEESRGAFIARMDSDDISLPSRLRLQAAFLEQNAEIGIVGSWFETFGGRRKCIVRNPLTHPAIKTTLIFGTPFAHPTTMFRKAALTAFSLAYEPGQVAAEDYDLWARALNFVQGANLPIPLLRYRQHAQQATGTLGKRQTDLSRRVRERVLARVGIQKSSEELLLHHWISEPPAPKPDEVRLERLRSWYEELFHNARVDEHFDEDQFRREFSGRCAKLAAYLLASHPKTAFQLLKSPVVSLKTTTPKDLLIQVVKGTLKLK